MSMRLVKKPEDPTQEAKEITKLAIGKPGGVDAETDKYDTVVRVFCLACASDISLKDPEVSSMVNSILLA